MMVALKNENIKPAIVEVMKNLYLLPSHKDFVNYPDFLELKYLANMPNYKERRISYFNNQLKQVQNEYDFIIIDVPPTLSIYTDSALYAADNVIIVLQTQQRSLDGAIAFWEYLQTFYNEHSNLRRQTRRETVSGGQFDWGGFKTVRVHFRSMHPAAKC